MEEGFDNVASRGLPSLNPVPQISFNGNFSFSTIDDWFLGLFNFSSILTVIKVMLVAFIVITIGVGIYFYVLQQEERSKRYEWLKQYVTGPEENHFQKPTTRWDHVKNLFASQNETDWRVAIIEADAMLDDLLIRLGYTGNSLGERLKSADPRNFPKRNEAWKAHLIRNKIAHEGSSFRLSHMQALRVMHWYEDVFKHARYIK